MNILFFFPGKELLSLSVVIIEQILSENSELFIIIIIFKSE